MAKLYNDSKTFVDMKMKEPPQETLEMFRQFMAEHDDKPTKEDIRQFVTVRPNLNAFYFSNCANHPSVYVKLHVLVCV